MILDVEELIEGPRVYSGGEFAGVGPGAERSRRISTGSRASWRKITTSEPIGAQKFFEGRLAGMADGKVRMELKGKDARVVEVPLEMIRKANLVVEW